MKNKLYFSAAVALALTLSQSVPAQQADMSFFVTSAGPGKGGDLGGLEGADRHCQTLATAAGAGNKTWRAYLSTNQAAQGGAVNSRDRIGNGPWKNAKGEAAIRAYLMGSSWGTRLAPASRNKSRG